MTRGKVPKTTGEGADALSMRLNVAPTARSRSICSVPASQCEAAAQKVASICGDADPPPVPTSVAVLQLPRYPIARLDTTALFDLSRRTARCEWVLALPKRRSLASPRPLSSGCDSTLDEPRKGLKLAGELIFEHQCLGWRTEDTLESACLIAVGSNSD